MEAFIKRWNFVRSETLEILSCLDDEKLLFKPDGEKWQPLFYQFGCIGRTQLIYAAAAKNGRMDFSLFSSPELPSKNDFQTAQSLSDFLQSTDTKWLEALAENKAGVHWPDGDTSLALHIGNLAEHERLHHGQLISYFTIAGFELPRNFKNNWAL